MGPLVCPSRLDPRLLPAARSPPTSALAPQPLLLAAVTSASAPSEARAAAADPIASTPGRLVVPLAPLRLSVATVTRSAGERDATPNARCGVRFSVKTLTGLQCGLAAPIHHLMMIMSTTPTTMRCCCSATPSWRRCCCPVYRRSTSSLALTCRFTLDIFTIQQDYREAFEERTSCDLELDDTGGGSRACAARISGETIV